MRKAAHWSSTSPRSATICALHTSVCARTLSDRAGVFSLPRPSGSTAPSLSWSSDKSPRRWTLCQAGWDWSPTPAPGTGASTDAGTKTTDKKKPTGRRNLSKVEIPEVRVEIADPVFDELVRAGKAERIGFEESYKLAWQRGGHRRLVIARVKYRTLNAEKEATIATAPMPDVDERALSRHEYLVELIALASLSFGNSRTLLTSISFPLLKPIYRHDILGLPLSEFAPS